MNVSKCYDFEHGQKITVTHSVKERNWKGNFYSKNQTFEGYVLGMTERSVIVKTGMQLLPYNVTPSSIHGSHVKASAIPKSKSVKTYSHPGRSDTSDYRETSRERVDRMMAEQQERQRGMIEQRLVRMTEDAENYMRTRRRSIFG